MPASPSDSTFELVELLREIRDAVRSNAATRTHSYSNINLQAAPAIVPTPPHPILRGFHLQNTDAAARYIKIYDTQQPIVAGSEIPKLTIALSAGQSADVWFGGTIESGLQFTYGLAIAATSNPIPSDATNPAINMVSTVLFIGLETTPP